MTDLADLTNLHNQRMRAIQKAIYAVKKANMVYQSDKLQSALQLLYDERTEANKEYRESTSQMETNDKTIIH